MSTGTALQPSFTWEKVEECRDKKRTAVYEFFALNMGKRFTTSFLHERFGPSFRTRKSEINRDDTAKITINNEYDYDDSLGKEVSTYWSVPRA